MKFTRIDIVGAPGSGKSHLGRQLAAQRGIALTELETCIGKTRVAYTASNVTMLGAICFWLMPSPVLPGLSKAYITNGQKPTSSSHHATDRALCVKTQNVFLG